MAPVHAANRRAPYSCGAAARLQLVGAIRSTSWTRLRSGDLEAIPVDAVAALALGDYRELRIETRRVVLKEDDEAKRLDKIDRSLSKVIAELKKVMSY